MQEILLKNVEETRKFGAELSANYFHKRALIFLYGDLGAGKTSLAQGFIKAIVPNENVLSPTYTYVQSYKTKPILHHFDLYRIETYDIFCELGLNEFINDEESTRLIEWPELIASHLRIPDVEIHLRTHHEAGRLLLWRYHGAQAHIGR